MMEISERISANMARSYRNHRHEGVRRGRKYLPNKAEDGFLMQ